MSTGSDFIQKPPVMSTPLKGKAFRALPNQFNLAKPPLAYHPVVVVASS
jgi:hypothetical protein